MKTLFTLLLTCLCIPSTVTAQYSGGTGEPNDPYQIATAADLIALGETPEDYDKHFILTADIDLDPNLPGRKVFDKAVIAPDTDPGTEWFEGKAFTGSFDAHNHTILHLTISGGSYLGLFGQLGQYEYTDEQWNLRGCVQNLGVVDVDVTGSGCVGGLAGHNEGTIVASYTSGSVKGGGYGIGGLVGSTAEGDVVACCSSAQVTGNGGVGGLAGAIDFTGVTDCYSTGSVDGKYDVGGLVGYNYYSSISRSYSAGRVSGNEEVGGLVGRARDWGHHGVIGFWDIETSGQMKSADGTGKTTAEMQDVQTYLGASWDFARQADGPHDIWAMPEGGGYPILWWQQAPLPELPAFSGGTGEPSDPYLITTAEDLNRIGHNPRLMKCHFKLATDVDLAGSPPCEMGDYYYPFDGVFDGNDKVVRHLVRALYVDVGGTIENLHIVDSNCVGSPIRSNRGTIVDCSIQGGSVWGEGGLVGSNSGSVTNCCSSTVVSSWGSVGGLVGSNSYEGGITNCYSTGTVSGGSDVGGLVGSNGGSIVSSYSSGAVTDTGSVSLGSGHVGGLVGSNSGRITSCYSTGSVSGKNTVGGLVGSNSGRITSCYSTGSVSGKNTVGGLVGSGDPAAVAASVWDVETSSLSKSSGGVGLTTSEMMDPYMLGLNGFANDPNWVLDAGCDYPRLAWEAARADVIPEPNMDWLEGQGTVDEPFRIGTAEQLILLGKASALWDRNFVLSADIDLDPALPGRGVYRQALIPVFAGVFDGKGYVVSNLTIEGSSYLGLFGYLPNARVTNLGVVDVNIIGSDDYVGGLVGFNVQSSITSCYSSGSISGSSLVGGLVGGNSGSIANCYSAGAVSGYREVGGLVGVNRSGGTIDSSYSSSTVSATGEHSFAGGLVGSNLGSITTSYSTGAVTGDSGVGGLIGDNDGGDVKRCYSTSGVVGNENVGGLIGDHTRGTVETCYAAGYVTGSRSVGGLVGLNDSVLMDSYSLTIVTGNNRVGGLVGKNSNAVRRCYSAGAVKADQSVGGLVGSNMFAARADIAESFWDVVSSGSSKMCGLGPGDNSLGRNTAEMWTAGTFLEAGWDFIDETANGTDDVWWILEGQDYPRLWWELGENEEPNP